ncbi:MAG: glycosyltransferase [Marinirhabdus sp.]|nr:glycosyltransferase [Marinirhabdus sp.]
MVVLYVFASIVCINCCFYLLFSKFSFQKTPSIGPTTHYPVSIIVCAKNEAVNLTKNVPYLLEQDYPDYEVILINDASTDETLEVIEGFAERDRRVKVVNVKNNEAFWGNKKYALTLGIKKAVHHRFLFTDADCKPASKQWLAHMANQLDHEKHLVLGYGAYNKEKGWLNKLIRYETLVTAIQYFSYAKAGIPYMGVGRNLAYTSNLFYENQGFMAHIQLPSGDDDLFVNKAATSENTALCYSKESFTISEPKRSFKAWRHQKRRHATTAKHYKPLHKFLLGLHYFANFLFWILFPVCLIFSRWEIALLLFFVRIGAQYVSYAGAAKKLDEMKLIPLLPALELFLVCFQLSIFISNSNSNPRTWK